MSTSDEKLPESVLNLLNSSRFIHLATCLDNKPHVSLMNYTFFHKGNKDVIIISTPKTTKKYSNMVSNPNVSILIHDWISVKGSDKSTSSDSSTQPRRNSLYELLANFNRNELSRVSVMLDGNARILAQDDPEYNFYKSLHLNNSKIEDNQVKNYIEKDDNALVLIDINCCKVTDTDNNVEEY
ncbi:hypothetical protein SBY92_002984 [Candida maltosa Xu316]|uniref:Pyridoxamine 5'-phosphate oxidase N-terminal domain-containing protein n=1 Tax=Candida maltosa (strain Xu316) TaxID=1245528 RepID=M3J7D6_CANMX|nr:hypothetical protein G210_1524 [Candida maltosa Xu316]